MLNKYKNEAIIAVSVVLLLAAIMYDGSAYAAYASKSEEVGSKLSKKKDIVVLQKVWEDKKVSKELSEIKNVIPKEKILKFDIQGSRAQIVLKDLTGRELNMITSKYIASIAVQIVNLSIKRDVDKYKLEVSCKW